MFKEIVFYLYNNVLNIRFVFEFLRRRFLLLYNIFLVRLFRIFEIAFLYSRKFRSVMFVLWLVRYPDGLIIIIIIPIISARVYCQLKYI